MNTYNACLLTYARTHIVQIKLHMHTFVDLLTIHLTMRETGAGYGYERGRGGGRRGYGRGRGRMGGRGMGYQALE